MLNKTSEITVESKSENLNEVSDFIENELGCISSLTSFLISVDEIFSNISKFAYGDGVGKVTFRLDVSEEETSLTIIDQGQAFDPLQNEEPDVSLSVEDREIGGLGIFLVKKLMDSVSYERSGNNNILVLKKKNS